MNVAVELHFVTNENKVYQRGSFPPKGRKPEKVALDWWRQIKREMPFDCELDKVIVNGEDMTEQVIKMEKALLGE